MRVRWTRPRRGLGHQEERGAGFMRRHTHVLGIQGLRTAVERDGRSRATADSCWWWHTADDGSQLHRTKAVEERRARRNRAAVAAARLAQNVQVADSAPSCARIACCSTSPRRGEPGFADCAHDASFQGIPPKSSPAGDDCAISDAFEVAGRRVEEQKKQRSVVGSRTSPYDALAT
jgi:hypothetical protein